MGMFEVDEMEEGIVLITFNRPEVLNAMTLEACQALVAILDGLAVDDNVRVIILTGAGRGFCSGHDLEDFDFTNRDPGDISIPQALEHQVGYAAVTSRIYSMPKPVISAVNGPATGGGLAIALASDTRICNEEARFSAAFVRLGISGCDVGTSYLLPRIVGPTLAFEMMLSGRIVDADEAALHRMVLRIVPKAKLIESARDIARSICRNSPFGVAMTKQTLWPNFMAPSLQAAIELENRTQILCSRTRDFAEASTAFLQKREPDFKYA